MKNVEFILCSLLIILTKSFGFPTWGIGLHLLGSASAMGESVGGGCASAITFSREQYMLMCVPFGWITQSLLWLISVMMSGRSRRSFFLRA